MTRTTKGTVGGCIVGEAPYMPVGWCDAGTCWLFRRTVLHHASEKGFVELVKALLEKGADVHAKDRQGCGQPLHPWRRALAFDSNAAMRAHVGCAGGRRCISAQEKATRRRWTVW